MKEEFSYKKSFLNITEYSEIYQNFQMIAFSIVSFSLPFFLKHPQWLIRIIINFFLIKSAMSFKFKKILPLIIFPSLGVLAAGILFGESTTFLLYFIPFIWIANSIYVISFKYFKFKRKYNSYLSIILSSLFKFILLGLTAVGYVYLFGFPGIFLTAMGIMQLGTALAGGFLAYFITKIENV
ncbi:hypothetical protein K8R47_04130 [archaeon]|nr:hypothetical protein [archaeon]